MLSATLSDPDGRETLRRELLAASRTRLSPLIGELKLDGPKTEKLLGIGADWGLKNLEAAAAFTEGKLAAEAAVQAEADTEREATNQIRSLLGEEGFAKYDECQKTFPARTLVQQFDKQLGPFPLNAIQREALARVIEAEPPEVACGLAGDFTVRQLVSPEGLDGRFAGANRIEPADSASRGGVPVSGAGGVPPADADVQYERAKAKPCCACCESCKGDL